METIRDFCKRVKISVPVYYKLVHRLKRRPTDADIEHHKATRITGRPRKDDKEF